MATTVHRELWGGQIFCDDDATHGPILDVQARVMVDLRARAGRYVGLKSRADLETHAPAQDKPYVLKLIAYATMRGDARVARAYAKLKRKQKNNRPSTPSTSTSS